MDDKIRIKVCRKGEESDPDKHWWEECHCLENKIWQSYNEDPNDLQKCGEAVIAYFNNTLRPHEKERILLEVQTLDILKIGKTLGEEGFVYLHITSWVGSMAIDAAHYYGKLKWYPNKNCHKSTSLEITKSLTAKEAAQLNKKDFAYDANYKKGEPTTRFDSEEECIEAGIKLFNKKVKTKKLRTILVLGSLGLCDPKRILVCPDKDVMNQANRLWLEFEDLNGWGCGKDEEAEVKEITDTWESLMY